MRAKGLDVSQVQGIIDWSKVADAGFTFVYVKATEGGNYVDPRFVANANGAKKAGLLVGAYHFLTQTADVGQQINSFNRAAGAGLDLPPALDVEYPGPEKWTPGFGSPQILGRACLAADCMAQKPIIYTYPYFAQALKDSYALAEWSLWIASYKDESHFPAESEQPVVPKPWLGWLFWQYSGNHSESIPGINGHVDHNVFNGTLDDLKQMCSAK